MWAKVKGIESSFRYIRGICMIVMVLSFFFSMLCWFSALRVINRAEAKVYILSADQALDAFASDRRSNLGVEARAQVVRFHELFFNLDSDERQLEEGFKKALELADGSARKVYSNLKESGYLAEVVSSNISQRIRVDSVVLEMKTEPFSFRLYGEERITRSTSVVTRSLVTEGWIRMVSRSEGNPHGLLIERWSVLENKDLKVEGR